MTQRRRTDLPRGLLASSAATLVLRVGCSALALIIQLALARILGASSFGVLSYCLAWAMGLSALAELGLPMLVVRKWSVYRQQRDWPRFRGLLAVADRSVLVVSVACVAVALPAAWALGEPGAVRTTFAIGMALVPALALLSVRWGALLGLGRVVLAQAITRLFRLVVLGVAVLGLWALSERSPEVAIACHVAAASIAAVAAAAVARRLVPAESKRAAPLRETTAWLGAALPMLLVEAVGAFDRELGVIVVGTLASVDDSGLYAAALQWAGTTAYPLVALQLALQPRVAALHASGDHAEMRRRVRHGLRWALGAMVLVFAGIALFGEHLLALYGAEFTRARWALVIVATGELASGVFGPVWAILLMTGHARDLAWLKGAGLVLHGCLAAVLVPAHGILGAACAMAIGQLAVSAAAARAVRSRLGVRAGLL